jgi:imidazolonepropionase-like amidohydrolase
MIIKFPVGIHGTLGETPKLRYGKKQVYPSTRMGEAAMLRQTLVDAQHYSDQLAAYEKKVKEGKFVAGEKAVPPAPQPMLSALIPLLKAELPLILTANRMDDILTAIRIVDEFKLRLVLSEGAEAHRLSRELASRNIPVLLSLQTALRLTQETEKSIYESAAILWKAGVKVAFQTGSMSNLGNLAHQAQLAIQHGLPVEEAWKALTINPAEIFGAADKIGSLEKGKSADIVIYDGDPLLSLSKIKTVIIRGKIVDNS